MEREGEKEEKEKGKLVEALSLKTLAIYLPRGSLWKTHGSSIGIDLCGSKFVIWHCITVSKKVLRDRYREMRVSKLLKMMWRGGKKDKRAEIDIRPKET